MPSISCWLTFEIWKALRRSDCAVAATYGVVVLHKASRFPASQAPRAASSEATHCETVGGTFSAKKRRRRGEPADTSPRLCADPRLEEVAVDGIIYLIGLIVIIMAILSFFGLR